MTEPGVPSTGRSAEMDHLGFIAAAYGTTAVVLGGYVAWMLNRGRRLSRQVPEERRRWM
jgi:heme exporter protein CcmD